MDGLCSICSSTSTNQKSYAMPANGLRVNAVTRFMGAYQEYSVRCPNCQVTVRDREYQGGFMEQGFMNTCVLPLRRTLEHRSMRILCDECGNDAPPSSKKCFHCNKLLCKVCSKSHLKKYIAKVKKNVHQLSESDLHIISSSADHVGDTQHNLSRTKSTVKSQISASIDGAIAYLKKKERDFYLKVDSFFRNEQRRLDDLRNYVEKTIYEIDDFCSESLDKMHGHVSVDSILSIQQQISKYKKIIKEVEQECANHKKSFCLAVNQQRISDAINLQSIILK